MAKGVLRSFSSWATGRPCHPAMTRPAPPPAACCAPATAGHRHRTGTGRPRRTRHLPGTPPATCRSAPGLQRSCNREQSSHQLSCWSTTGRALSEGAADRALAGTMDAQTPSAIKLTVIAHPLIHSSETWLRFLTLGSCPSSSKCGRLRSQADHRLIWRCLTRCCHDAEYRWLCIP